jgi:hypothetical protein
MVRLWRSPLVLLAVLIIAVLATAGTALAAGVWSAPEQVDHGGTAVAGAYFVTCPSASLCFGADAIGPSDAPASYGGPTVFHVPASGKSGSAMSMGLTIPYGSGDNSVSLLGLQCPSVALCVGIADYDSDEDEGFDVVASTTPAAGPSSWIEENVSDSPTRLSCPTTTLCVGAGSDGAVVTSEAPASHAWQATKLATAIVDVDCPSAAFCAAIDSSGNVWTSTDPTGGSGAWSQSGAAKPLVTAATADGSAGGYGDPVSENFSCSGPSLCVAAGPSGTVLVSTDPAGTAAWSPYPASVHTVTAVDCVPAVAECLAGDDHGDISTSVGPDANAWTELKTGFDAAIGSGAFVGVGNVSCTARRCVASPLNSASPPLLAAVPADGGPWKWTAFTVATHDPLVGIACPAANDCVAADQTRYIASANLKRGASSWKARTEDNEYGDHDSGTLGMSCYSASGCLAAVDDVGSGGLADSAGGQLARFDPAGGAHGVHLTSVGDGSILYITCAQGICVTGYPGAWLQSTHPALNSGWHTIKAPRFDVTCLRGNTLCVALRDGPFPGTAGPDLLTAPRRTGPWTSKTIDPGGQITGLACTSSRACVVVDAAGRLLVSTQPTAGPATWHLSKTDLFGFNGVACQNSHSCVAVDNNGGVVIGRP